jgi:hypothetical protein
VFDGDFFYFSYALIYAFKGVIFVVSLLIVLFFF